MSDAVDDILLGIQARAAGDPARAIKMFTRALQKNPSSPDARALRGIAKLDLGQSTALYDLEAAAHQAPGWWHIQHMLGEGYLRMGSPGFAIVAFEQAAQLPNRPARVLNSLGAAYLQAYRYTDAIRTLQAAIWEVNPEFYPVAECNLGTALTRIGCVEQGLQHIGAALESDLDQKIYVSGYIQTMLYSERTARERYTDAVRYGRVFGLPARHPSAYRHDRLRVGLIGADFRDHPSGTNMRALVEHLDRGRFVLHGYMTAARRDDVTVWYQDHLDDFRVGSEDQLYPLIIEDEIDIPVSYTHLTLPTNREV